MSLLNKSYDREQFISFIKNEFLSDYDADIRPVRVHGKSLLQKVSKLGTSNALNVTVFEAHCDDSDSGKRIAITQDAFRMLRDTATRNALIVFYSEGSRNWRFSLLTSTLELSKDGKIVSKVSNPRRFSYLLGEEAKTVTPYKYLIKLGKVNDLEDLQKRFSVEVVNNDFYTEIAKLYDKLVGTDTIAPKLVYPEAGEASHQFAVRLIGRVIFSWFLREKQGDSGKPLIDTRLLSASAIREHDYYHTVLAPLFFEVLNKKRVGRIGEFGEGLFGDVPYLNGGLFSPQYEDYYKFDSNTGSSISEQVNVPNEWLSCLFELLETYHFTVDENTSVDIDLSIDPEMLGRIFENLLARINPETGETVRKSTGSFYTPREVVEYMVDASLSEYLLSKTGIDKQKIESLISYDLVDDLDYPLNENEKISIVKSLSEVKILDPACGSGAFPIGILQKIVFILQQIDPEARMWFGNQIKNTPPELKQLIEREFKHKNFDYIRKLGVIRESIFGVDIQPIATEIARLRCFLTLIVDERVNDSQEDRGVYPLPNLDFKFVTANTLVKLGASVSPSHKQTGLFEDSTGIDELKSLRDDYFNSHNGEKEAIKFQFSEAQKRMLQRIIAASRQGASDVTHSLSAWNPFTNDPTDWFDQEWMFGIEDGFDIVISNPPYVEHKKLKDISKILKGSYTVYTGSSDLSVYFFERGIELLKDGGTLVYINTNKFFSTEYGKKLRQYLLKYEIKTLLNFEQVPVFENVLVSSCVTVINKLETSNVSYIKYKGLHKEKKWKEKVASSVGYEDYPSIFLNDSEWSFLDQNEIGLKKKIESRGKKLKDIPGVSIKRGVTTGYDPAFIIKDSSPIAKIADDISKPLLKGEHIKSYVNNKSNLRLLFIPWHYPLADGDSSPTTLQDAERKLLETRPDLYKYLKTHEDKLKSRNKSETGIRYEWYALQRCAASYSDLFTEHKIVWPLTAGKWGFAYDGDGHYLASGSFMLVSRSLDLNFILGILNSKLMEYYFKHTGVMTAGGAYTLKKSTIEDFPIATSDPDLRGKIIELASKITLVKSRDVNADTSATEEEINDLVYKLYDLSKEEINIVESSLAV